MKIFLIFSASFIPDSRVRLYVLFNLLDADLELKMDRASSTHFCYKEIDSLPSKRFS